MFRLRYFDISSMTTNDETVATLHKLGSTILVTLGVTGS